MANIQFSNPFVKNFTHQDVSVETSASTILPIASAPEKRVYVIIQNKSSNATIQVILSDTGSVGVVIPPLGSIALDNYNGPVRVIASAVATPVHLAYATV